MPTVPLKLGDIRLNGVAYKIDMPSYRVRDIVDFAPRAAEPGGSIVHSELGLYQPYLKTDWRHGFGFFWEEDAMGYLTSSGAVDTRHPGVAMLMTAPTDNSSGNQASTEIRSVSFNGDSGGEEDYTLFVGGSQVTKRRNSDGVFAQVGSLGVCNAALETNLYIHLAMDGARIQKITKATAPGAGGTDHISDAGLDANSTDYKWLATYGGYIYAGKDASSMIHRSTDEALADLEGTATDADIIAIGGDLPTIDGIVFLGKLYVTRQDGLFQVGEDGNVRRILDFSNQISNTNFRSIAVFNNKLIFPIRDTIYTWNGATLSDVTPPWISDSFPYVTYGRFNNFVSVGGYLYMSARTNPSAYEEHIICFDGVGWHKIAEPIVDASGEIVAMGYDVENNYLWYCIDDTSDEIWYIEMQNQSEFPYANFSTSADAGTLTSSRMGMGFRRITKSVPSIFVEASNCTANRFLTVFYSLDGGTWTEWGGAGQGNITSNGVTELTNPLGGTNDTLEFNYIQIRITFTTDSTIHSPILEGFTLRFIMRPNVLYGHSFSIVAADDLKMGASGRDLKSVRDIYAGINTARGSAAPITFVDPFGVSHQGYISSVERVAVERHGRETRETFPDIESRIIVNFVEVNSG